MIRFDDSKILSYKLVYLNCWISISTENVMSEELAATAIAIAIILKRKNTEQKKRGTVLVKPWLCKIIPNNFAKVLKAFSLVLRSLYALAFTSHKHLCFSHSAIKASFTFTFFASVFGIFDIEDT